MRAFSQAATRQSLDRVCRSSPWRWFMTCRSSHGRTAKRHGNECGGVIFGKAPHGPLGHLAAPDATHRRSTHRVAEPARRDGPDRCPTASRVPTQPLSHTSRDTAPPAASRHYLVHAEAGAHAWTTSSRRPSSHVWGRTHPPGSLPYTARRSGGRLRLCRNVIPPTPSIRNPWYLSLVALATSRPYAPTAPSPVTIRYLDAISGSLVNLWRVS